MKGSRRLGGTMSVWVIIYPYSMSFGRTFVSNVLDPRHQLSIVAPVGRAVIPKRPVRLQDKSGEGAGRHRVAIEPLLLADDGADGCTGGEGVSKASIGRTFVLEQGKQQSIGGSKRLDVRVYTVMSIIGQGRGVANIPTRA